VVNYHRKLPDFIFVLQNGVSIDLAGAADFMKILALLPFCAAVLQACATTGSTEALIRGLERQQVQAAIARDQPALERLFAPDFKLVNPAGAIATRAELLTLLVGGAAPYASAQYHTDELRTYDDVVVSMGTESVVPLQGIQAGQTVRRRITHVWQRRQGRWQLVLRHATLVAAP
jgi:hypothetical protein